MGFALFMAEADCSVDAGACYSTAQAALLIARVQASVEERDFDSLCELLLAESAVGVDPRALEVGKRTAIEMAVTQGLAVSEVARSYLGRPADAWLCALLAEFGDEDVLYRVQQAVDSGVEGRELGQWLFLLASLGTVDGYELLRFYRTSDDDELQSKADQILRRYPEGWPVSRLPQRYF